MPSSSVVSTRYTLPAIWLHWLIAVLVFGLFGLGLAFEAIPRASRLWWINLHTIIGLGLLVLVLARLAWRVGHTPPPLPEDSSPLVRKASAATHHLMYLLMVAIPLVGLVAYFWHGRIMDFGAFQINPGLASTRSVYDPAEGVHKAMAFALMGLVALHVVAGLWHHFIKQDGLLWRMWPGGR